MDEVDTTVLIGGRHTSTPTPCADTSLMRVHTPTTAAPPPPPPTTSDSAQSSNSDVKLKSGDEARDSALSTSPVGTDAGSMTGSQADSARYSSWSGSELKDATGTQQLEGLDLSMDAEHTYMNIRSVADDADAVRMPAGAHRWADRTYENMAGETTHFEDLSAICARLELDEREAANCAAASDAQKPLTRPAYISSV